VEDRTRHRFEELLRRLGEIDDVGKARGLLGWDELTKMPALGAEARAEQGATLARIGHELRIAPELGELLEELRPFEEEHEHDSFEASVIRVARRDHDKAVRVPPELRADRSRAFSRGYQAWLKARESNDYEIFRPHLEHTLELTHCYVACFEPYDDPYDPLLDDFEPGMKTAEVAAVFETLRPELVSLLARIGEPVDDSCLRGRFPEEAQRRFALAVLERWGMDDQAWRLDDTVHPFQDNFAATDIRLTSNFQEDGLWGVLACMHEFGHGLYERQVDPAYRRTPLGRGVSYAFHESQSRLWENLVGRSLATWRYLYPQLRATFPEQLASVSLETFHGALNRIAPTVRRLDADEVTYSLHIILRFELERDMLSGAVTPAELPEAFDAKVEEYLGVRPRDVVEGVLQDAHWSDTSFGYFPTYALGNVISLQLWQRTTADLGNLDEQLEQGELAPLREWLREHVHRWGRVLTPGELLQRAAGGPLDPAPYLRYLDEKVALLDTASAL
jgi:carboxypeptidase Taq